MIERITRYINLFLLGSLTTLLVFGFNTPFLPDFQVKYTISGSQPEWVTALSTIGAVLAALGIAVWSKSLGELFYKSNIVIKDKLENIQENRQGEKQGHTRLLFENQGNATAEDVEVYVSNIYDEDQSRANFLPVPLSWTHDGRSRRSFHPNQYGYLDFCRIDNVDNPNKTPKLVLVAGGGIPAYEDISSNTNKIELTVFEKSGQTKKYEVSIEYRRPIHITNISLQKR